MAAIRNGCIARGVTVSPGFVIVYTVPQLHALLLKSIMGERATQDPTDLHAYMQSADSAVLIEIARWTFSDDVTQSWSGWTALNQGDKVYVNATLAAARYWFAGAVLPYAGGGATLPLAGEAVAISSLPPSVAHLLT